MKKMVTSAGLMALGAVALHGYDPGMIRTISGSPFTVAATVRGFYDDNPTTLPDEFAVGVKRNGKLEIGHPEDSFGFEVSPSVHVSLPLDQTFIRAGYVYSLRYFEDREPENLDQSHEFNALLRHTFSPRHVISVDDSFSVSEEPAVTDRFGIITAPTRSNGDTLRNRGTIDDMFTLTELVGLGLGYVNTWYDYDQTGGGSRSALLDRIEQSIRGDVRFQVDPTLTALVGYTFGMNNFIGNQFLVSDVLRAQLNAELEGLRALPDPTAGESARIAEIKRIRSNKSDVRDSHTHYVYVGAEKDFSHKLRGSLRMGAQMVDYFNSGESDVSPYADAALTYVYMPECSLQLGARHSRNATDISTPDSKGQPTLDQESTSGYAHVIHRLTRDLTGSLLFQVQNSSFSYGGVDGEDETMYLIGLNLEYRINLHWSVEVGHNYDLLDSGLENKVGGRTFDARGYDRNRTYIGVRASY